MHVRHGIGRADVIVVIMMGLVGFSLLFPLISQKRAEVRRMKVLTNAQPALTDKELDSVERLANTVTVDAPSKPEPGIYSASILVPDDPRITGGMLKQALHMRIFLWSGENDFWLTGGTMKYDIDPSAKRLTVTFPVHRKSR